MARRNRSYMALDPVTQERTRVTVKPKSLNESIQEFADLAARRDLASLHERRAKVLETKGPFTESLVDLLRQYSWVPDDIIENAESGVPLQVVLNDLQIWYEDRIDEGIGGFDDARELFDKLNDLDPDENEEASAGSSLKTKGNDELVQFLRSAADDAAEFADADSEIGPGGGDGAMEQAAALVEAADHVADGNLELALEALKEAPQDGTVMREALERVETEIEGMASASAGSSLKTKSLQDLIDALADIGCDDIIADYDLDGDDPDVNGAFAAFKRVAGDLGDGPEVEAVFDAFRSADKSAGSSLKTKGDSYDRWEKVKSRISGIFDTATIQEYPDSFSALEEWYQEVDGDFGYPTTSDLEDFIANLKSWLNSCPEDLRDEIQDQYDEVVQVLTDFLEGEAEEASAGSTLVTKDMFSDAIEWLREQAETDGIGDSEVAAILEAADHLADGNTDLALQALSEVSGSTLIDEALGRVEKLETSGETAHERSADGLETKGDTPFADFLQTLEDKYGETLQFAFTDGDETDASNVLNVLYDWESVYVSRLEGGEDSPEYAPFREAFDAAVSALEEWRDSNEKSADGTIETKADDPIDDLLERAVELAEGYSPDAAAAIAALIGNNANGYDIDEVYSDWKRELPSDAAELLNEARIAADDAGKSADGAIETKSAGAELDAVLEDLARVVDEWSTDPRHGDEEVERLSKHHESLVDVKDDPQAFVDVLEDIGAELPGDFFQQLRTLADKVDDEMSLGNESQP